MMGGGICVPARDAQDAGNKAMSAMKMKNFALNIEISFLLLVELITLLFE